jgi:hypothetical protein
MLEFSMNLLFVWCVLGTSAALFIFPCVSILFEKKEINLKQYIFLLSICGPVIWIVAPIMAAVIFIIYKIFIMLGDKHE